MEALQPPSAAGPAPGAHMWLQTVQRAERGPERGPRSSRSAGRAPAAALKRATSLSAVRAAYLLTDLLTAGTLCETDGMKSTDQLRNLAQHDHGKNTVPTRRFLALGARRAGPDCKTWRTLRSLLVSMCASSA